MRVYAALLALLVALLACVEYAGLYRAEAQTPGPRYGGTLRVGMQTDPVGLDPHLSTATATKNMMEHVYEPLVFVAPDGRLIPGLAESWEASADGLTWTFALRKNAKFHNGRPLTGEDVVYSINRVRDARTRSPWAGNFADVDTITAPSPHTVVFRLKKPFSPLLAKLASVLSSAIVAREVVEKDEMNVMPVGTGPFRFISYTPQQRMVLVRSGDYWEVDGTGRRMPYVDRIEFIFLPDAVARTTAIRAGTVDFIEYVPSAEVRGLRTDPNVTVVGGPSANFRGIYINNTVAPFNNVKVRQALAWSVNRKEIIDTALFGVGGLEATGSVIPPGNFYALSRNVYDKPDPERAKRLLSEAGFAGGIDAELYVTSTYDFLRTPAEIIQANAARAGFRLKIVAADWSVYLPTVFAKRYTLTILGTSGQVDPDDYLYNNFRSGDRRNYINFTDAAFDKLIEDGQLVSNEAQRKRIYEQAQMRLMELAAMPMLFHSTTFEAVRKHVHGFEHQLTQSYQWGFRKAWLSR